MFSSISLLLACGISLSGIAPTNNYSNSIVYVSDSSENVYTPPTINSDTSYGKDGYEDNDGVNSATNLNPDNDYTISSFHTHLDANIDTYLSIVDIDIYSFILYQDSVIYITIENENPSYSLSYCIQNYRFFKDTNEIIRETENIDDNDLLLGEVSYSYTLLAGNYFIYLRGNQSAYSGSSIDYSLDIIVNPMNISSYVSIGDLRFNKALQGVIWISEYVPGNILSFSDTTENYLYYDYENDLSHKDYLLEDLYQKNGNSKIRIATYYIWGASLKAFFSKLFKGIINMSIEDLNNKTIQNIEIQNTANNIEAVIQFLSSTGGFIVKSVPLGILIDVLEDVSINLIDSIAKNLFNNIDLSDITYMNYLSYLNGLMDGNKESNMTIQIPLYYRINKQSESIVSSEKYYISSDVTLEDYVNSDDDAFFYSDNKIYINPGDSGNIPGKIYGLNQLSDGNGQLMEYSQYLDVDPEVHNCPLNEQDSFTLMDGEYRWYSFTSTETKTYYIGCFGEEGENIVVDAFKSVTKGYSYENCYRSYSGGYDSDEKPSFTGCYFDRKIEAGTTIYFRIRNVEYLESNFPIYFKIKDSPLIGVELPTHSHCYNYSYVWRNTTRHYANCDCGDSILEGHVILENSQLVGDYYTCLLCGGRAEMGIIGPYSLSKRTTTKNGSYKLPNGNIILNEKDVDAFFNGELTI